MSFRTEKKFIIHQSNFFHFYKWLEKNNCKKIYKKRLISSIYFDNKYMQMYSDSDEGTLPRKKIRLRNYNNNSNDYLLEKKISSPEGRFKISQKKSDIKILKDYGIFDSQYGICKPILTVSYLREYFTFNEYRITFDVNISYNKVNSNFKLKDNLSVIEFKKKNMINDNLNFKFPYSESRFSKYSRGFELINGRLPK